VVSSKETNEKLEAEKEDSIKGYLVCERCAGYYELQEGDSLDDFESCQCGGKLKYHHSLNDESNELKPGETVLCPLCLSINPVNIKNCYDCGKNLDETIAFFEGPHLLHKNIDFDLEITPYSIIKYDKGKFDGRRTGKVEIYEKDKIKDIRIGKTTSQLRFDYEDEKIVLGVMKNNINKLEDLFRQKNLILEDTCPACKTENPSNEKNCVKCGKNLRNVLIYFELKEGPDIEINSNFIRIYHNDSFLNVRTGEIETYDMDKIQKLVIKRDRREIYFNFEYENEIISNLVAPEIYKEIMQIITNKDFEYANKDFRYVIDDKIKILCPLCGQKNPEEEKYCFNCGKVLATDCGEVLGQFKGFKYDIEITENCINVYHNKGIRKLQKIDSYDFNEIYNINLDIIDSNFSQLMFQNKNRDVTLKFIKNEFEKIKNIFKEKNIFFNDFTKGKILKKVLGHMGEVELLEDRVRVRNKTESPSLRSLAKGEKNIKKVATEEIFYDQISAIKLNKGGRLTLGSLIILTDEDNVSHSCKISFEVWQEPLFEEIKKLIEDKIIETLWKKQKEHKKQFR